MIGAKKEIKEALDNASTFSPYVQQKSIDVYAEDSTVNKKWVFNRVNQMNTFTVTFIGHRYIYYFSRVEELLVKILEPLFLEKEYICFYVGRNGDFDQMASSVVRRLKKRLRNDNSSLIWALPYLTAEFRENEKLFMEYYDEIEFFNELYGCYPKSAIQKRNRLMIDKADLVIAFVKTNTGGAYQALRYAKRQGKRRINIADLLSNGSDAVV